LEQHPRHIYEAWVPAIRYIFFIRLAGFREPAKRMKKDAATIGAEEKQGCLLRKIFHQRCAKLQAIRIVKFNSDFDLPFFACHLPNHNSR
jgi:hypothetical protein